MTKTAGPTSSKAADADWEAALRGDRDAFQAVVRPHLGDLLKAARRELRYHVALGNIGKDELTPAELAGEVLARAWRDRHRRPPLLSMKAWLLAKLFEVAEGIVRHAAREVPTVSLEEPVPPGSVHEDDAYEEVPWEEVIAGSSMTPEDAAAVDEGLVNALPRRSRQAFVMHDLHRVQLSEVALLLRLSVEEAAGLVADARRRFGAAAAEPVDS